MPAPKLTNKAQIALAVVLVLAAAIPVAWVAKARIHMASLLEDVKGGNRARVTAAIEELSHRTSGASVREIIAAFDDETQNRRNLTAVLVRMGAPAVGPLIERLRRSPQSVEEAQRISRAVDAQSGDIENTYTAKQPFADALGRIGAPAVAALERTLKNGDPDSRRLAAQALERAGKPAVPALLEALKDGDPEIRVSALTGLLHAGYPGALSLVLARLKDPSETSRVRVACCGALSIFVNDPSAWSALVAALDDPDKDVASAAVRGLLYDTITGAAHTQRVVDTLAQRHSEAATTELVSELSYGWAGNAKAYFVALEAVARTHTPAAKDDLAKIFRRSPGGREARLALALEICDGENGRALVDTRVSAAEVERLARDYAGALRLDESSEITPMLLLALERYGNVKMAGAFYRSDNSYLAEGAEFWAKRKGVSLESTGAADAMPALSQSPAIESTEPPPGPHIRTINDFLSSTE